MFDLKPGEDSGFLHRLALEPDEPAAHGLTPPQRGVDRLHGAARLDIVGEDLVGVVAATTWLTVKERAVADRFEDKVGARAEDEQMAFAGRDDELEGAVVLAGDNGN